VIVRYDGVAQRVTRSGPRVRVPLPPSSARVIVEIRHPRFHPCTVSMQARPGPPVRLELENIRQYRVLDLRTSDIGIVVRIALGTIRSVFESPALVQRFGLDAAADDANPVIDGIDFRAGSGAVWNWPQIWLTADDQLLGNLAGAPVERLRQAHRFVQHRGSVFVLERKAEAPPHLVAVYVPYNLDLSERQSGVGMHLFLHPYVGADNPLHDPTGDSFAHSYLLRAYLYLIEGNAVGYPQYAMHLAERQWFSRKKAILVLPLGRADGQLGDILSQGAAMRLLVEINFALQRRVGVSPDTFLTQDVTRVALSSFSASTSYAHTLMNRTSGTAFDGRWREVHKEKYCFDPHAGVTVRDDMVAWFRANRGERRFRAYSQNDTWALPLASALGGSASLTHFTTTGDPERHACLEAPSGETGSNWTVAWLPPPFWNGMPEIATADFDHVHVEFPRRFVTHALRMSGFETA
jgi:hypothetical protein